MAQMEEQLRGDEDDFAAEEDMWQPNDVARALWALGRLKAEPDAPFVAAALRHCFSRARRLNPTAICRLLWSIGNVQGWAPPRGWVARALAATHARIGGFAGPELATLATSLARLEHRPPVAWLETFAGAAAARMGECDLTVRNRGEGGADGAGACCGLLALCRRGRRARPKPCFPHLLTAPPPLPASATPPPPALQSLANMLWALATLGYRPDASWLDAAWARFAAAPDAPAPAQLQQLAWALPALGWAPRAGGDPAWDALLARGRGAVDTPRAVLQRMRWEERAARAAAKAGAPAAAAAV
jgi:hypothetical protein